MDAVAYQSATYVAAGSWCEIIPIPDILPDGYPVPSSQPPYVVKAGLVNLNSKPFTTATFLLPCRVPIDASLSYRAIFDPLIQVYRVEAKNSVARQEKPLPSAIVGAVSPASMSSRAEENLLLQHSKGKEEVGQLEHLSAPRSRASQRTSHGSISSTTSSTCAERDRGSKVSTPITPLTPDLEKSEKNLNTIHLEDDVPSEVVKTLDLPSVESANEALKIPSSECPYSWLETAPSNDDPLEEYRFGSESECGQHNVNLDTVCDQQLETVHDQRYHHLNYHGQPVLHKSATPPEVSLWLALTGFHKPRFSSLTRELVVASQAGKLIDPIHYSGPTQLLERTGTSLRDAVCGYVDKVYEPSGSWVHDHYDRDELVPLRVSEVDHWHNGNFTYGPPQVVAMTAVDGDLVINDDGRMHAATINRDVQLAPRSRLCIVQNAEDLDYQGNEIAEAILDPPPGLTKYRVVDEIHEEICDFRAPSVKQRMTEERYDQTKHSQNVSASEAQSEEDLQADNDYFFGASVDENHDFTADGPASDHGTEPDELVSVSNEMGDVHDESLHEESKEATNKPSTRSRMMSVLEIAKSAKDEPGVIIAAKVTALFETPDHTSPVRCLGSVEEKTGKGGKSRIQPNPRDDYLAKWSESKAIEADEYEELQSESEAIETDKYEEQNMPLNPSDERLIQWSESPERLRKLLGRAQLTKAKDVANKSKVGHCRNEKQRRGVEVETFAHIHRLKTSKPRLVPLLSTIAETEEVAAETQDGKPRRSTTNFKVYTSKRGRSQKTGSIEIKHRSTKPGKSELRTSTKITVDEKSLENLPCLGEQDMPGPVEPHKCAGYTSNTQL
ncbi:hypothetical protein MMC24_000170 [Lignoscripta atroalba]|nr:hypothetical protein [Lignoscripta atroalba]